jgi:hypothetical protein
MVTKSWGKGFDRRWSIPVGTCASVAVVLLLLLPGSPPSSKPQAVLAAPLASSPVSPIQNPLLAAERGLSQGEGPAHGAAWSCSPQAGGVSSTCSAARPSGGAAGSGSTGWRKLGPLSWIGNLSLLAYDDALHEVLGLQSMPNNQSALVWAYSNGTWRNYPTQGAPAVCSTPLMVYDPSDAVMVYLSGPGGWPAWGCSGPGRTYTLQNGTWKEIPTPNGTPANTTVPAARSFFALAYDPAESGVVMFGGASGGGRLNDTWLFKAGNWTELSSGSAPSPSPRADAAMVYDPQASELLLYGGFQGYPYEGNDTWEFSGGSWTLLSSSGTNNSVGAAMVYDAHDGYPVLISGCVGLDCGSLSSATNWTMKWQNGSWSPLNLSPTLPVGVVMGATYDNASGEVVIDAQSDTFTHYGTGYLGILTWLISGGGAKNLSGAYVPTVPVYPASSNPIVYDEADNEVLLFAGASMHDTWVFGAAGWKQLALTTYPTAREMAGLTYDERDGYVLLFGGLNVSAPASHWLNDTWEFAGNAWSEITPVHSPPAGIQTGLAYDDYDGYTVLTETSEVPFQQNNLTTFTWSYARGVWTNISASAGTPNGAPAEPPVYDNATSSLYVFLEYGFVAGGYENRTWRFHGGLWSDISASVSTPVAAPFSHWWPLGVSLAYDPALEGVVAVGGANWTNATGGYAYLNGTWLFSNLTWSSVPVGAEPYQRQGAGFAYDELLHEGVLLGGQLNTTTASVGAPIPGCSIACDATWVWGNGTIQFPAITALGWSPALVELGTSTVLSATVGGDSAPLTYSYADLPPGCSSVNSSTLSCTPNATGTYSAALTVSDPSGNSTLARASLDVVGRLHVQSFTATPSTVPIGNRTLLSVVLSGGTSPFQYNYSGLPPGCGGQSVPALPCDPGVAGNYSIGVNVSDGQGLYALGTANLTVSPAGSPVGLHLVSFLAAPAEIVLGNNTTLSVRASGTAAPLSFTYTGLPPGCASSNVSALVCTPNSAASYAVVVSVSDPQGTAVTAGALLRVDPAGGGLAPTVYAFRVEPAVVQVGQNVSVQVTALGPNGSTPDFSYTGFPPGCASVNLSAFTCAPTVPGDYPVRVAVRSGAGPGVTVPAHLLVEPLTVCCPMHSSGQSPPSNWNALLESAGIGALLGALLAFPAVTYFVRRRRLRQEGNAVLKELMSHPEEVEGARVGR